MKSFKEFKEAKKQDPKVKELGKEAEKHSRKAARDINKKKKVDEGMDELKAEYEEDAKEQAERIIELLDNSNLGEADGFYYDCKHLSRQLQDLADNLELAQERAERASQANPASYTY